MFLHLSVSHSVHRGGLPQCILGYIPGQTPPPPSRRLLLQMVCILLECILVTGHNEAVAKVIFLHLFVILFTGGSTSVHARIPLPTPQDQAHPRTRHTSPRPGQAPFPPRSRLRHTINEQPVPILLECILVTTRKRSLRRLCFYRCVSVHRGGGGSPSRGGSPSWGGFSIRGGVLHPVNVRAVRILLDCILVANIFVKRKEFLSRRLK